MTEELPKRRLVKGPKDEPVTEEVDACAADAETQKVWHRDEHLICPVKRTDVYGRVPKIVIRNGPTFPAGNIFLRYGEQFRTGIGFGFRHIWADHYGHIPDHDIAMERICSEVSAILMPGTELFYENRKDRMNAHRLHSGFVVLSLVPGFPARYSVITGGFSPGNTKGSLVGSLV